MIKRAPRVSGSRARRWRPTPSFLIASTALFIALGGSAVAATGLIHAGQIAPGAVTSKAIRDGAVEPRDLSTSTRSLIGGQGVAGTNGANGAIGLLGTAGAPGASGSNGANGPDGANGAEGARGSSGANGANGPDGANGTNGTDGVDGTNGTDGTNGINGTIAPLSAKQGLTALPTGAPATTVVELGVPAGNYVVLAKTELSQTGAGDSVECLLKSGTATVDQAAMKTLPALAAVPASLQGVITTVTSLTELSVQCNVAVANGSANYSSLIAIPTA
jgi:Collagen triple helix repeat (20 copies)